MHTLPIFIEATQLAQELNNPQLQLIDMSATPLYLEGHIPGAVHLDYSQIVTQQSHAMGALPELAQLQQLFCQTGLRNDAKIVIYDADGGGKSARLFWTLAACGFSNASILNGGRHAWLANELPLTQAENHFPSSSFSVHSAQQVIADKSYILEHLNDPNVIILDARSPEEYAGSDVRAERGGHIPGARNLDWTLTFDPQDNFRIRSEGELKNLLEEREVNRDLEIIVHCQTHHRSALLYAILKSLGYEKVRGYHGSWSEWGNDPELPIEN